MPASHAAMSALDSTHSRAVCDEIGERLRDVLDHDASEIPFYLRRLVDRLAELERVGAPSIVPEISDMRAGIAAAGHAASAHARNSAK